MSDPEKQWGPWSFVRRDAETHDCPRCDCRAGIQAILWTGFNVKSIHEFMGHHGKGAIYGVRDIQLSVSGVGLLPPGWWLYSEKGVLETLSAVQFIAMFGRP